MTDPAPSPHDEQVRRLLAAARHDEPIPPEVGARLDGVLADLAAGRDATAVPPPPLGPPAPPGTTPGAPVVDLAARRRRRQGAALLVAAAAVVAIGIGVGTVTDRGGGAGDSAGGQSSESFDRNDPDTAAEDGGGAAPSAAPTESEPGALMRMDPLVVSADTFAADAERYRGEALAAQQKPAVPPSTDESDFACDLGSAGAGVLVPVLYDGAEAVLAYRPPTDDAQVVDLLQCGTGDVVRTTTLPVP